MTQHKDISNHQNDTDYKAKANLAERIANASIDSLVALDRDLKIRSWNAITEIWSGFGNEAVIGKYFFDVFPAARQTPNLQYALQEALSGRKTFLPCGPGFYLPGHFEAHFVPLMSENGEVTGVLQIIHDVAHRVKAENELRELNQRLHAQYTTLQHANEETATFAKIAAHDLKEPLRKIYTFVEYIKVNEANQLTNSGRGYFRRIQESVQRMSLLTDDVSNYLSLSAGETLQRVDLSAILSEMTGHFKSLIDQTNAQLYLANLPVILGYPKAMWQLFRHVLGNSLKFVRPDVAPEIHISCEKIPGNEIPYEEALRDEEYYVLTFKDNGIGFEQEYSTRIFGLFERLHPQGSYRGSGMGLALALKAARLHQGFMKADSSPESGSMFYCYLPVSTAF
ncbi:sensor histidine kinase [Flavobacterium selenitireducens]|uniref:sensor histidine kinase n=1 Tax=Flavobacterium selenitireducens TaxID=2722704 RepID=UPI00168BDEB7|nr:ATP-binding protein [Flavobacterium selenitireducens]MBD3583066.1 PAS domain-containing protein [Flavobacterium selenitireducens]